MMWLVYLVITIVVRSHHGMYLEQWDFSLHVLAILFVSYFLLKNIVLKAQIIRFKRDAICVLFYVINCNVHEYSVMWVSLVVLIKLVDICFTGQESKKSISLYVQTYEQVLNKR